MACGARVDEGGSFRGCRGWVGIKAVGVWSPFLISPQLLHNHTTTPLQQHTTYSATLAEHIINLLRYVRSINHPYYASCLTTCNSTSTYRPAQAFIQPGKFAILSPPPPPLPFSLRLSLPNQRHTQTSTAPYPSCPPANSQVSAFFREVPMPVEAYPLALIVVTMVSFASYSAYKHIREDRDHVSSSPTHSSIPPSPPSPYPRPLQLGASGPSERA